MCGEYSLEPRNVLYKSTTLRRTYQTQSARKYMRTAKAQISLRMRRLICAFAVRLSNQGILYSVLVWLSVPVSSHHYVQESRAKRL